MEKERERYSEAWRLQFEYMAWRRAQGLEPGRTQLNLWELAMDQIGEAIDRPGRK